MLRTATGRVFSRTSREHDMISYFACLDATPRGVHLADVSDAGELRGYIARVQISGRYVAFVVGEVIAGGASAQVVVFDLRLGQRRYADDLLAPQTSRPLGSFVYYEVDSLLLNDRGFAAWVAGDDRHPTRSIHVHDSRGARELERGTEIDPASLDLGRRSVTWVSSGTMHAAALS